MPGKQNPKRCKVLKLLFFSFFKFEYKQKILKNCFQNFRYKANSIFKFGNSNTRHILKMVMCYDNMKKENSEIKERYQIKGI